VLKYGIFMADNKLNLPSGFGGLTRFGEEYTSKINLKPVHVIIFIILIITFRVLLGVFFKI
jgi:preprotein translocase subunit Sec61beta